MNRGGQGRDRTGDLPLFRRTLVPTELPGRTAPEPNAYRIVLPILGIGNTLATLTGLEPATSAVTGRRANQLRHRALLVLLLLYQCKALLRVTFTAVEPYRMLDTGQTYPLRDSNPRYRLERAAS